MSFLKKWFGKDKNSGLFGLPGEYVNVERPIKMLERKTFTAIRALAGDSIEFSYRNSHAGVQFKRSFDMERPMNVDTAVIIEIKDEFGLDVGCGLLIGESKK